ncbi:MAG: 3-dehydroquinate synthase [Clostridia bacterium]|nr:3-dehydroquinate synthase [Clostridia bacterium]
MLKLNVNASSNYTVTIDGSLNSFNDAVIPILKGKKIAVICDENAKKLHIKGLKKALKGENCYYFTVKSGEHSKSTKNYIKLINCLAEKSFTRSDAILTFGGGVVGDLGAFVASTFMRGITLVAMPTTLLSMVDSSVGGKTAVNLKYGKNLLGTFYQPKAVYINTEYLKTLPEREMLSGYGEIIKYAFLDSRVTYLDVLQGGLENLIYKCLQIKSEVVNKDEKESGLRKILNLGHTLGHAIESLSSYSISHGECVVKGIKLAIDFSKKYYGLSDEKVQEMYKLLTVKGHNLSINYPISDLVKQVYSDKKRQNDSVSFIAIKDIGNVLIEDILIHELSF